MIVNEISVLRMQQRLRYGCPKTSHEAGSSSVLAHCILSGTQEYPLIKAAVDWTFKVARRIVAMHA